MRSNNYLKLSIIFLSLILIIYVFKIYKKENLEGYVQKVTMRNPHIQVKSSPQLKYQGRGLFATKDYKKNETIEFCPTLVMKMSQVTRDNIIRDHLFQGSNIENSLLALGYCSLINHSKEKQNCTWNVADDDEFIEMIATEDIKKGDEILTNYGAGYWIGKDYPEY